VEEKLDSAKNKLAIIEVSILATTLLYGVHLYLTKGVARHERMIKKDGDDFTVTETTEYASPTILSELIRLWRGPYNPS
jgi:hypothetical protein